MKDKISLATKGSTGNDRRTILRSELDVIRGQQSGSKNSRGKIFEQLKVIQEGITKKVRRLLHCYICIILTEQQVNDLKTAKAKIPFKNVAEVDTHIK